MFEFLFIFVIQSGTLSLIVIQTTEGRKNLGSIHSITPTFVSPRFFASL